MEPFLASITWKISSRPSVSQVPQLSLPLERILLDNFHPDAMKEAVKWVDGRVPLEASGGIDLSNLRAYGETGVDFVSMGALTHSVKSMDLSLKTQPKVDA